MPHVTYILCALTSVLSALLLFRSARSARGQLLFWGGVFFLGMTVNNVLQFVDAVVVPDADWSLAPNLVALVSIVALLYGLIWEAT